MSKQSIESRQLQQMLALSLLSDIPEIDIVNEHLRIPGYYRHWPTVCRLESTQPLFSKLIQLLGVLCPWITVWWPEWVLPPTVILKKQKEEWEDEFATEKKAYNLLKPLRGTVIPYFHGEVTYDESTTLVFGAMSGSTLFDHTRNKFPENKDEALLTSVRDAFQALTSYGVEYEDQKLDNILWVDERVMNIDFEQVKF